MDGRKGLVGLRYELSRRRLLQAGIAGAGHLAGLGPARGTASGAGTAPATAPAGPAGRPNVVLIVSDDQGWTDFGFMGHPQIKTPNLDRLASQAALFPQAYVAAPLCRPSLASLLTGLYPHQHRICCNDPAGRAGGNYTYMKDLPTIPRLLGKLGYRSLQTGKFWEQHFSSAGFTEGMTVKGRHGGAGLAIGRQSMDPIYKFIDDCAARKDPFFLWYAPMMPHTPHNPPARLLAKYAPPQGAGRPKGRGRSPAAYYAMCEWFDETCGALLDHLDKRSLRDDTLVVFVVDNGWTQGYLASKAGAARGKRTPYEGGVRTPVILHWPGRTKAGRYADLVASVDLAPTILAACGAQPTGQMQGLNLLGAAAGQGPLRRKAVFGEAFVHTAKDMADPAANLTHRWVRAGDVKLVLAGRGKGAAQLYNLADDPFEARDVSAGSAERVAELRGLIGAWWKVE